MNTLHAPNHRSVGGRGRGAALVIVLATLVLIVGLAVGFLYTMSTERAAARGYKATVETRQLAETAVNLVQAQIHQATSGLGSTRTWASQPGMIRTYSGSGAADGFYKLYSASPLFVSTFSIQDTKDEIPTDWATRTNEFVDLNEPVSAIDGSQRYPIVDPSARNVVEGFDYTGAPAETDGNELPMPVRWLYVLKDGQIVLNGDAAMTADNPPIGRIAFWADDETAKINVNTASEGTYWDTPRVNSSQDRALGQYQPVGNEFQRYPGHPAMTSLSPVFGTKLTNLASYYAIAPRVADGGSAGGEQVIDPNAGPIALKTDRLYATPEEILLSSTRSGQGLTREDVERARFFITSSSRAPDVNLFNRPRVSLWPIHATATSQYRTAYDDLMAFCSTIGGRPYYFQRANPISATADIGMARNQELLAYLRTLTDAPIPGFGGDFKNKYGVDRDQILTEIFDYVRSTNLLDASTSGLIPYAGAYDGSAKPITSGPSVYSSPGSGQVVPAYDASTNTRGFGRFPTVTELALVLFVRDTNATNPAEVPVGKLRVQAFLIPELFTPTQGWPPIAHNWYLTVSGMNDIQIDGQNPFPVNTSRIRVRNRSTQTNQFSGGGQDGVAIFFNDTTKSPTATTKGREAAAVVEAGLSQYPFVSDPFDIDESATTIPFQSGELTVTMQDPAGNTVQTLHFPFNASPVSVDIPIPTENSTVNSINFARLSDSEVGRFAYIGGNKTSVAYLTSHDTIRSVRAGGSSGGDARLIAAHQDAPATLFERAPGYGDPLVHYTHSLKGANYTYFGGTFGRLLENAIYASNYPGGGVPPVTINDPYQTYGSQGSGQVIRTWFQDVPLNGAKLGSVEGDWDTGMATHPDGAYVNKPDEGNIAGLSSGDIPYYSTTANGYTGPTPSYFSPNRMLPSAGMLGSLSTGVKANVPWRTLLFRPEPAQHFGASQSPPDHLLLDLFTVPVVEPYAISEPLSTAGRINMNYQIMPFTYITRETGLYGVLEAEKVMALPNTASDSYKGSSVSATDFRQFINVDETLEGFRQRFDSGKIFRSATEICDIHLVPVGGTTYAGMPGYWSSYQLTGDNLRERPYTNIYPRLTTKSNTFTVHYRVQALQPLTASAGYNPTEDFKIIGEARGSAIIERYVDPNDGDLTSVDFATEALNSTDGDINTYYRFRTVNWQQFNP